MFFFTQYEIGKLASTRLVLSFTPKAEKQWIVQRSTANLADDLISTSAQLSISERDDAIDRAT